MEKQKIFLNIIEILLSMFVISVTLYNIQIYSENAIEYMSAICVLFVFWLYLKMELMFSGVLEKLNEKQ